MAITLYAIAVASGSAAPTAAQVVAGVNYGAVTVLAARSIAYSAPGNIDLTPLVSGLTASTPYDVYAVAFDGVAYSNVPVGTITTASSSVNLTSTQAVPAQTLNATAAVTVSASSTQAVPTQTLSATTTAPASLSSAQMVPAQSLAATASAPASLSSTQAVPAQALTATASAPAGLSSAQAVPAQTLAATAAVVVSVTATQAVPAQAIVASATVGNTVNLTAAQAVPPAALAAAAQVVVSASTTQSVPAQALVASASAPASLASTQAVPSQSLVANVAKLPSNLTASQAVPAQVLSATASALASVTSTQAVPNAALVATAAAIDSLSSTQALTAQALVATASVAPTTPVSLQANQVVPPPTLIANSTTHAPGSDLATDPRLISRRYPNVKFHRLKKKGDSKSPHEGDALPVVYGLKPAANAEPKPTLSTARTSAPRRIEPALDGLPDLRVPIAPIIDAISKIARASKVAPALGRDTAAPNPLPAEVGRSHGTELPVDLAVDAGVALPEPTTNAVAAPSLSARMQSLEDLIGRTFELLQTTHEDIQLLRAELQRQDLDQGKGLEKVQAQLDRMNLAIENQRRSQLLMQRLTDLV